MSVGNVAQSVWSVSRRSPVSWDQQQEANDQNQSQYTQSRMNELVSGRPRISRCLFGPTDPQETRRMAYEETTTKRYTDRNRWNFDFYSEKPISGRFEWKKVSSVNESKQSFGESGEQSESFWSKKKSAKS